MSAIIANQLLLPFKNVISAKFFVDALNILYLVSARNKKNIFFLKWSLLENLNNMYRF